MLLPNELVECIVDKLHPSIDKSTLCSCALVGRAWVFTSQRGIFHTIFLKIPILSVYGYHQNYSHRLSEYLKTVTQLITSFEENPRLSSYCQCLEVDFQATTEDASPMHQDVSAFTAAIISRLSNLRNISLHDFNWDEISSSLKVALTNVLRIPSVIEVSLSDFEIHDFSILASLLNNLMHLKTLKVGDFDCSDEIVAIQSDAHSPPPPGSVQLDKLAVGNLSLPASTWFQQGSCPFGFRNLRSLQSPANHQITSFLLQQAGASLEKLKLDYWAQRPEWKLNSLVHLGNTTNLKELKLCVYSETLCVFLPWIVSLFEPIRQKRYPLQRLCIELLTYHSGPDFSWDHWTALDNLFEKPEFALLESVDIKVGSSLRPAMTVEKISEKLAFLTRTGKLKLE